MDDEIREQIIAGEILAVTLDTSTFERHGLALESGLLAQLKQFRGSDIRIVIATTVANEVRRHLANNAVRAFGTLEAALRETARHKALPLDTQNQVKQAVEVASAETAARARQRFDDWMVRVGATLLPEGDFASITEVMRRYEAEEPPFGASSNKKHEFPDAVALLTLEGWARSVPTKIVTVTQDNDWLRYAAQSKHLIGVDDLAVAMAALQRRLKVALEVVELLAASINAGDPLELMRSALDTLNNSDGVIEFDVDADSQFHYELEYIQATFEELGRGLESHDFETVALKDGVAAVKVDATATALVDAHFRFEKWDGIDKEYLSMGTATLSRNEQIQVELLITVALDDGKPVSIEEVEVLPTAHRMTFGEIEPDWMADPEARR